MVVFQGTSCPRQEVTATVPQALFCVSIVNSLDLFLSQVNERRQNFIKLTSDPSDVKL